MKPRRVSVACMVLDAVEVCQADLCTCFDILAESESEHVAEALEHELFAAHRALNLLRVAARAVAGPERCVLLRSPGKG